MRRASRRLLIASAVGASVATAASFPFIAREDGPVRLAAAADKSGIPGHYIVTMKPGRSARAQAGEVRATKVRQYGAALNGFAAELSDGQLNALRKDPDVQAIEPDQIVRADVITQRAPLPWGLDRIDQRNRSYSKTYSYFRQGTGVDAYVLDTGIDVAHPNFGGRATFDLNTTGDGNDTDCNGHGTHVAGTIGSKTYGVAKNVRLHAVKVLGCDASGTVSQVLAGINHVASQPRGPKVVNLSLGGPKSTALNDALYKLSSGKPVFVAVAAGNGDSAGRPLDACTLSPSSASLVVAVGATTVYDNRATWSSVGGCVDIHAPGYGVWSTWPGGGSKSLTGTSMAAPHVAGAAALYYSYKPTATSWQVQTYLKDKSTKNVLGRIPRGTPNRLLYKSSM